MKPEKESHIYSIHVSELLYSLMHKLALFLFFAGASLSPSFAQHLLPATHRFFNNFEDSLLNSKWMNPATIEADVETGNHFSKTDSSMPYSSGIENDIPADLKRKNFRISIHASIRAAVGLHCQLVVSVTSDDSVVAWNGFVIPDTILINNTWNHLTYSVLLPGSIPPDSRVKIFLWNDSATSRVDVDDFEIRFTEEKFPSFWPAGTE